MTSVTSDRLILLPADEARRRAAALAANMTAGGDVAPHAALVYDNTSKFYLTGRVFDGWLMLMADGTVEAFVKRPVTLHGPQVKAVRKLEEIPFPAAVERIALEFNAVTVAEYRRIERWAPDGTQFVDLSPAMRATRAVKTPYEVQLLEQSGVRQTEAYIRIPSLYRPGMTDLALQIEIERLLRSMGCLGQFRISGNSMELFMGNILAGDNSDAPSPYDFAMGGAGIHPSIPVGANGTVLRPGMSVMVDANGNFTGYMTDMTRTFSVGDPADLSPLALTAHDCSIAICNAVARAARPGVKASELYDIAARMAAEAGLSDYFMGHRQKAGFVGHGIGIEVNEAPVLAPRSRDIIAEGNVIALEPKFVIPGTGAVGIENTYVISPAGQAVCLTNAPQEILPL